MVLAGGQLCEYSNWKQRLGLHNDPINLKMASVREARNSDRRFCFEVVTPQYKRVYQATSEEDMNNWIMAINNAVKSTIESGGSMKNFDSSLIRDEPESSQLKNIQSALTGKTSHYYPSIHNNPLSSSSSIYRRTTVGARPSNPRRKSASYSEDPDRLLQLIRDADASNSACADCGSQVKAEWVSINLGIILCIGTPPPFPPLPTSLTPIECSGLHRSLGTHISKVRSLTLDTTSFTPDLVDLLIQLGNRIANSVWEARSDPTLRPTPQSSRESRLKFITAKYSLRSFVAPLSPTLSLYATPAELLVDATRRNDITASLYALALGASPNATDHDTGTDAIMLAVAAAESGPTYPLAELLLQNGGIMPFPVNTTGLPQPAKNYVALKTAKRLEQMGAVAAPSRGASTSEGSSGTMRERQMRERERLAKRVSSGARMHRGPIYER